MQLKVSVNIIVLEQTQKVLVELLLSFMFPFYQHPLVVIMISKINGQMWINDKLEPDKFKKCFQYLSGFKMAENFANIFKYFIVLLYIPRSGVTTHMVTVCLTF